MGKKSACFLESLQFAIDWYSRAVLSFQPPECELVGVPVKLPIILSLDFNVLRLFCHQTDSKIFFVFVSAGNINCDNYEAVIL